MVENFSHEMLKLEVSMGIWWGYGKQLNMGWKWWIVSYVLLWKVKILTIGTNQIMFLIFKCYVIPCYISSKNSTSNICPMKSRNLAHYLWYPYCFFFSKIRVTPISSIKKIQCRFYSRASRIQQFWVRSTLMYGNKVCFWKCRSVFH